MMANFDRFIDPKTRKVLVYHPKKQSLFTKDGTIFYPVINGIPRFIPPEFYQRGVAVSSDEVQTGQSFGDKWCNPRSQAFGSTDFDRRSLEEQFLSMLGCGSMEELQALFKSAKITLNAGCGVAWSEYLFDLDPKAERHCVDISLSVEIAHKKTAHMPNVTISQTSIFELPYPEGMFDIVYSCGVVHHTPDPKRAVLEIGKRVASRGILGIYIYNKKPFVRELCDQEIRKLTTKMSYKECMDFSRKMTMFGKALNSITKPLVIQEDIDLLGIKKGKYNL
ncbi:MAG: methyltransferase domain-containing protein [Desulfobacteraceae bacterium]|nr:methyltransferase domain-containing protein [Desulfobacteraceae bacterium]